MIHYILEDIWRALRYLPFGVLGGVITAVCLCAVNVIRCKRDKEPLRVGVTTCLITYFVIILCITFLSRELGSRSRKIDMELFSTWGRTKRAHAFVVENVLLFIPYGFLVSWMERGKIFFPVLIGLFTSLMIETLQLITGRGFFQVDDILTNTVGMLIGAVVLTVGYGCWKKYAKGFGQSHAVR